MFVPRGVFHRLHNDGDEPFVLLAIWPEPAVEGANGIHDLRLQTWGTGYRLRPGRELAPVPGGERVTEPGTAYRSAALERARHVS